MFVLNHTNYNRNGGLKMGWIITLIVGAIIGAIASSITGKNFQVVCSEILSQVY